MAQGATLAGKLAAEVVADRAAGREYQDYQSRDIRPEVVERAGSMEPKAPMGVTAPVENAIAWGAGMEVASKAARDEMIANDPDQVRHRAPPALVGPRADASSALRARGRGLQTA